MTALGFTSRDLECLPDIPGFRYEIIDGELIVSKNPQLDHQDSGGTIYAKLRTWSEETKAGRPFFTPGLVFASDNDVTPDLVWVSQARLAHIVDDRGHLNAAPELVVEVLSPGGANERRDRELKLGLYSRQGVQEYWIVDWRRQVFYVYRRQDTVLQLTATLQGEAVLTSPLLPGFSCPVSTFWDFSTA